MVYTTYFLFNRKYANNNSGKLIKRENKPAFNFVISCSIAETPSIPLGAKLAGYTKICKANADNNAETSVKIMQ